MSGTIRCGVFLIFFSVLLSSAAQDAPQAQDAPPEETPPLRLYQFEPETVTPPPPTETPVTPADRERLEACRHNLEAIAEAFDKYRKAHEGKDPQWLSDLVPDYLADANRLLCPADEAKGDPLWEDAKDPKLPVSYMYELVPTRYDEGRTNLRRYGDVAPLVRCWHHLNIPRDNGETVLTINAGLRLFSSIPEWFRDPEVLTDIAGGIRKAVESGSSETMASFHFGLISILSTETQTELLAALEKLTQDPEQAQNAGAFKLLGALYRNQNRISQSLAAYHRAASLLPDDAEPHFLLGTLYEQQGQVEDAIRSYEAGLRSQPDTVEIILVLSRLLAKAERTDEIKKWYEHLKGFFRPNSRDYRYVAGEVAFLVGDDAAAKEHLEWIYVKDQPHNIRDSLSRYLITRLSQVEARLGNEAKAREYRILLDPGEALVGTAAPNFSWKPVSSGVATAEDSATVELSSYRGKVVVLFFWGARSGRATALMPNIRNLYDTYKTQDFVVIGVNREPDVAVESAAIGGLAPYPVAYEAKDAFNAYKILTFPTLYFIDREGFIRYRHVGFTDGQESEFDRKIQSLLQSPKSEQ